MKNGFRVRLLLLLLLAASACTSPPAPAGRSPVPTDTTAAIRAMTFNIRYGTAPDDRHVWPLRRDLTFRVIRDHAPALLGVQEALRFQLDEIADALPHFGEIGVGREDGVEAGEYSAILYDRARFDALEQGTFWLSDTPEVPGSASWGNRITRIATWARFRDRRTQATFYVYNTHWDHESQPSRERSAQLLLARIRGRTATDDPVIVMGDFNAGEENAAFRTLLAGDAASGLLLYDTFRAAHPDARSTGTYHAFRGDRSGEKIDAILATREWQTLNADIILFTDAGRYPSDHFPLTATLVLSDIGARE